MSTTTLTRKTILSTFKRNLLKLNPDFTGDMQNTIREFSMRRTDEVLEDEFNQRHFLMRIFVLFRSRLDTEEYTEQINEALFKTALDISRVYIFAFPVVRFLEELIKHVEHHHKYHLFEDFEAVSNLDKLKKVAHESYQITGSEMENMYDVYMSEVSKSISHLEPMYVSEETNILFLNQMRDLYNSYLPGIYTREVTPKRYIKYLEGTHVFTELAGELLESTQTVISRDISTLGVIKRIKLAIYSSTRDSLNLGEDTQTEVMRELEEFWIKNPELDISKDKKEVYKDLCKGIFKDYEEIALTPGR